MWALLEVERIPSTVWEPCCGSGNIVRELRAAGHTVFASDLVDYGCPDSEARIDFLLERRAPAGIQAIVTNFPFKLANQMVEHALELCPQVFVLLRLSFLESARRSKILDGGQLARVRVFRSRLPMMHRRGWAGPKATSQVPYAWFVWDREHRGPTVIDRISTISRPYNADDDIRKSVAEGFRVIRARVRSGGRGWGEP